RGGEKVARVAAREAPVAERLDPEPLPDRAVGAVGGEDVAGADSTLGTAVAGPDRGGDALRILLERDDLRGVLHLGTDLLRLPEQHRLQADLGDEQPRARAELLDALVDVLEVVLELLAAEALDGDDRTVLDELSRGRLCDLLLDPDRAVVLHRPLVHECCPRVDRRADVALDDERRDAPSAEEN